MWGGEGGSTTDLRTWERTRWWVPWVFFLHHVSQAWSWRSRLLREMPKGGDKNNSDNNSSSSNETQLKQKEKSALSNVRIKNDKTEKVFCMTALLQPSSMERKKKKKGLWPARPLAAPPPRPRHPSPASTPPSQRTSSRVSRIPRFTGGNRSHLPLFTRSLEIKHMEILELYLHLAVRWQSSPSLLGWFQYFHHYSVVRRPLNPWAKEKFPSTLRDGLN